MNALSNARIKEAIPFLWNKLREAQSEDEKRDIIAAIFWIQVTKKDLLFIIDLMKSEKIDEYRTQMMVLRALSTLGPDAAPALPLLESLDKVWDKSCIGMAHRLISRLRLKHSMLSPPPSCGTSFMEY